MGLSGCVREEVEVEGEAIVFFKSSVSLPASSASPQNAASCPSLVASEVPPSPSGTAQDFTVALSNIQEVREPTRSSKVGLDSVQDACCENDWRV